MNKSRLLLTLLFATAILVSCSSEPEIVEVTRVVTQVAEVDVTRLVKMI